MDSIQVVPLSDYLRTQVAEFKVSCRGGRGTRIALLVDVAGIATIRELAVLAVWALRRRWGICLKSRYLRDHHSRRDLREDQIELLAGIAIASH